MTTPRQPLQNILWLVGERVGRTVVTATVLGLVARHLQPEGFGRLNFAVTVVLIASYLANLGLDGLVVAELVRRPAQAGAVLGTAFRLRLLGGIVTTLLVTVLARGVMGADAPLVCIVVFSLLFQPFDVIDLWFQRHLDSRRTVVARTVGIMAGATLKLWLVASDAGLAAFAWAQVADTGFIAFSLFWAGRRSPHPTGRWIWDAGIARVLWRKGAILGLSSVAVALALRTDQLLVRHWLGGTETGIYFAASRLVEIASFTGATIMVSFFPALAASHTRSPGEYAGRLQVLFDTLSGLGWIFALGSTALGWLVIRVLFGPAYAAATPILIVQAWACLIALNASARWHFILLSASPVLNLYAALLHAGTVVLVGTLLMPRWGSVGAAGALFVACIVSGVLTSFIFPALRPCAATQIRGLFIPFTPGRWGALLGQFRVSAKHP